MFINCVVILHLSDNESNGASIENEEKQAKTKVCYAIIILLAYAILEFYFSIQLDFHQRIYPFFCV